MKRATVIIAAGAMLLVLGACTIEFPGRSFKAGDFECSKTGSKIEIDKDVGTEIVKGEGHMLQDEARQQAAKSGTLPADTVLDTLTALMEKCNKFLEGGGTTPE